MVWRTRGGWWYELFTDPGHVVLHRSGPWPSKSRALTLADTEAERRTRLPRRNSGPFTEAAKQAHELHKTIVQLATKVEALAISAEHHLGEEELRHFGAPEYVTDLGYDISAAFEARNEARRICEKTKEIVHNIDFRVLHDPGFFKAHPNYLPCRLSMLRRDKRRLIELQDVAASVLLQFNH